MSTTSARMRQLIGTTAEWAANDIVIGDGELAIEVDGADYKLKCGDGTRTFSQLPYITGSGGGAAGDAVVKTPPAGVSQSITAADAADTPLTLNAATGQTGNLFKAEQLSIGPKGQIVYEHTPYDQNLGIPMSITNRTPGGEGGDVVFAPDKLYSGLAVRAFDANTGAVSKQASLNSAGLQFVDERPGDIYAMTVGHSGGRAYWNVTKKGGTGASTINIPLDVASGVAQSIEFSLDHVDLAAQISVTDGTEPAGGWNPKEVVTAEKLPSMTAGLVAEAELVDTSTGAGDAGKPVKLNVSGVIDSSMLDVQSMTFKGVIDAVTQPAPATPANGDVWVAKESGTADASWGLASPVASGDMLIWDGTQWTDVSSTQDLSDFITLTEGDARYLRLTGGTLTGQLVLPANPTAAGHAARKAYVDAAVAGLLNQADGDSRYVELAGDTMTGDLTLPGRDPTNINHAARKAYVDTLISTRLDQTAADNRYLQLSGGTLTGMLTLPTANPTNANHATRKAYVDSQVATRLTQTAADARYVELGGDTMTGALSLPTANPSANVHAAHKGYVDAQVATKITQAQGDARYVSSRHDASVAYKAGDAVIQAGVLWKCKADIPAKAFDANDWTPVSGGGLSRDLFAWGRVATGQDTPEVSHGVGITRSMAGLTHTVTFDAAQPDDQFVVEVTPYDGAHWITLATFTATGWTMDLRDYLQRAFHGGFVYACYRAA